MSYSLYYPLSLSTRKKLPRKMPRKFPKKTFIEFPSESIKNLLVKIMVNFRRVKAMFKPGEVDIFEVLDMTITMDYFVTKHNKKLFDCVVQKILTRSKHECIYLSSLWKDFDLTLAWLDSIAKPHKRNCLLYYNVFLLDCIVKPLIYHFFKPVKTNFGNEIKLFRKNKWHSYRARILNGLIDSEHITIVTDLNLKPRGSLRILPKNNDFCKYRIIMSAFQNDVIDRDKCRVITGKICRTAREINRLKDFYTAWKHYVRVVNNNQIYCVKVDLEDAFGSINLPILKNILLSKPGGSKNKLSYEEIDYVIRHVENQILVVSSNKVRTILGKWTRGLLQGDVLSSCLCELYMSVIDSAALSEFRERDNMFLHRTVDDIIFCSTEVDDIKYFYESVASVYKLNENKTVIVDDKCSNETVDYCGMIVNIKTKEVLPLYKFENRQVIRHKFKLWNIKKPIRECDFLKLIKHSLRYAYNNNYFANAFINTVYNSKEAVLKSVFNSMILVAYKLDAQIMAVIELIKQENRSVMVSEIYCVVKIYCKKILNKLDKNRGGFSGESITYFELKTISIRAFILVLQRRKFYRDVVNEFKKNRLILSPTFDSTSIWYFRKLPDYFKQLAMNRKVKVY